MGWGSEELGGEHAAARAAHAAAPLARVPRGGTPKGERDDGEEGGQGRKEGRGGVGREGGLAAVVPGGAAVLAFSSAGTARTLLGGERMSERRANSEAIQRSRPLNCPIGKLAARGEGL